MILSLAVSTLKCVFGLLLLAEVAWSQTFDNFLFVGIPGMPNGTVTSLSLETPAEIGSAGGTIDIGEVSYFDAAGLSTVYTLSATPSEVINSQTIVFTDKTTETLRLADLHDISFYKAELTHESNNAPPNWFRLTNYQGVWSGVFRVGNQVYSVNRETSTDVIEVRTSLSDTVYISPTLRGTVSAVFSTDYFNNGSTDRQNIQAPALESIHVLDGLLSDSLGLSLQLDRIVTANVFDDVAPAASSDFTISTALNWKEQHADWFGADDKLATLFFTDQQAEGNTTSNTATIATDDAIIVQPHDTEYQFALAHNFGKLLNLRDQSGTLQDWQQNALVSLPAVHWSQQQQDDFDNNPPASQLLQVLNNDQTLTETDSLPEPAELDRVLVESDSEEREAALPQDDPITATSTSTTSGGGAIWLCLVALAFFRQSFRLAITAS